MARKFEGQDPPFDLRRLSALIAARRQLDGLSLREVARQADMSFSTVDRVQSGEMPDLTSFLKLAAWAKIPPAEFFASGPAPATSTLEQVAVVLHADRSLPAGAAQTITDVVKHILDVLTTDARLEAGRD